MVAIVRGPSYYDPRRHADRALARRNLVLRVLAEQGVITDTEAERAAKKPLGVAEAGHKGAVFYPAFLDLVRRQLRADYEESDLTEAGLTVFSTLDPLLQEKAESALASELERQDKSARKASHGLEGVVIVTTPQTGEVVAIVGGRRASFDGFNRALDAKRPIGSLAKPLVYLAALETGRTHPPRSCTTSAVEIKLPNGDIWKPANFDKEIRGDMPAVRALTQSLNLPTVNLGLEVGLKRVARTFVQLGLEEKPAEYPSMLLGATNLSPIEVARMYNTLANGGFRSPLRSVRAVLVGVRQAVEGAAARGGGGCAGGCGLHGRPHAGRSHGAGHRAARPQVAAAGAGRGWQDRDFERLPRQLVLGLLGSPT